MILSFCLSFCLLVCAETKVPVAVYLEHLPSARIGQWSDEQIITDLQSKGFYVLPLDCSAFPSTSPELETTLVEWCRTLPQWLEMHNPDSLSFSLDDIYYIPEGYTYDKVAVWNILEHGAEGTIEHIIDTWNQYIVPRFNRDSVSDYSEMVDKHGSVLDYNLYLDIIYPSGKATRSVPLLLTHAGNAPRQNPYRPNQGIKDIYGVIFQLGFLTTGYAYAIMDHCYNPLARNDVYKYFDDYTLDHWNGLAANTACVRYLKSHLNQYNLNGKIGSMGMSKASYASMRLSDPQNAEGNEYRFFNGKPNTRPQPWPNANSAVDVVYTAAGNGAERLPDFVNAHCVPIITSAGRFDRYHQWPVYPKVVSHLNHLDHNFLSFWMEDLGHHYPSMGTDVRTGENRYMLFKRYFDRYLKPQEVDTTAIFYVLPKPGMEVNQRGESRVLPPDSLLPEDMLDIPAYEPITVRYLYDVDIARLPYNIRLVDSRNREVKGSWTKCMQGTCLTFTPKRNLKIGDTYTLYAGPVVSSFLVTNH